MTDKRYFDNTCDWGIILGGSSGMGLATVKKMALSGMNIIVIHRDQKSVEKIFLEEIAQLQKTSEVQIHPFNINALVAGEVEQLVMRLQELLSPNGRVKLLLHAIAKGNLKPLISAANNNVSETYVLSKEDFELTNYAMSVSIVDWTRAIFQKNLFANNAAVIALSSEGVAKYWPGYAAVAAAKSSLETISRSMAVELAPFGIRTNVIQAGVTDTPSLRKIPGSEELKSVSMARNPFKRLTTPEDVANAVCLLCLDEASWINGALLHVDGGEHCC